MEVKAKISYEVTPIELANCLFNATPEEFANVFLELGNLTNLDKDDIRDKFKECAKLLASDHGSNKKEYFYKMCNFIKYYEMGNKYNGDLV